MDYPCHITVSVKEAPQELRDARPGERVAIEATFKVSSISEESISGELIDMEATGKEPSKEKSKVEVDEDVDLSDRAMEKKKPGKAQGGDDTEAY